MRSILDVSDLAALLARVRAVDPATGPRWGRMSAPEMLTHLSDRMRHALGDAPTAPRPGLLRWPPLKQLVMYWIPWPRGRTQGPAEAFVTRPTAWAADLAAFEGLIARFVAEDDRRAWPDHAFFGSMTHRSWARFSHRHFDYHLRQFGA